MKGKGKVKGKGKMKGKVKERGREGRVEERDEGEGKGGRGR